MRLRGDKARWRRAAHWRRGTARQHSVQDGILSKAAEARYLGVAVGRLSRIAATCETAASIPVGQNAGDGAESEGSKRAELRGTIVKVSPPYGRANVCAVVAITRLVKTTSMDSRVPDGAADTDDGPSRESRAMVARYGGASGCRAEVDRATERLDGSDATTPYELREPTHLPQSQPPTAFKSVLSHGRTR